MSNRADGVNVCQFIDNLDRHHKVLLLLGGLCLPFDSVINTLIKRFIAAAIGKMEAPWLTKKQHVHNIVFYHYVVVLIFLVKTCNMSK